MISESTVREFRFGHPVSADLANYLEADRDGFVHLDYAKIAGAAVATISIAAGRGDNIEYLKQSHTKFERIFAEWDVFCAARDEARAALQSAAGGGK